MLFKGYLLRYVASVSLDNSSYVIKKKKKRYGAHSYIWIAVKEKKQVFTKDILI